MIDLDTPSHAWHLIDNTWNASCHACAPYGPAFTRQRDNYMRLFGPKDYVPLTAAEIKEMWMPAVERDRRNMARWGLLR